MLSGTQSCTPIIPVFVWGLTFDAVVSVDAEVNDLLMTVLLNVGISVEGK